MRSPAGAGAAFGLSRTQALQTASFPFLLISSLRALSSTNAACLACSSREQLLPSSATPKLCRARQRRLRESYTAYRAPARPAPWAALQCARSPPPASPVATRRPWPPPRRRPLAKVRTAAIRLHPALVTYLKHGTVSARLPCCSHNPLCRQSRRAGAAVCQPARRAQRPQGCARLEQLLGHTLPACLSEPAGPARRRHCAAAAAAAPAAAAARPGHCAAADRRRGGCAGHSCHIAGGAAARVPGDRRRAGSAAGPGRAGYVSRALVLQRTPVAAAPPACWSGTVHTAPACCTSLAGC